MTLEESNEQDIIYITDHHIRTKMLKYLSDQIKGYVKLRKMADDIKENAATVNFHCKGLEKCGLVDSEKVAGKNNVKITEKGTAAITEVRRRQEEA